MPHQSPGIEMRHEARSWLSKGYGIAPRLLMMDRRLSIGPKALFCYISSIAGSAPNPEFGGPASWPTRERICAEKLLLANSPMKAGRTICSLRLIYRMRFRN